MNKRIKGCLIFLILLFITIGAVNAADVDSDDSVADDASTTNTMEDVTQEQASTITKINRETVKTEGVNGNNSFISNGTFGNDNITWGSDENDPVSEITLNDDDWDEYFNYDGTPKDVIESGSVLMFEGEFNDRYMLITIPLNLTSGETQAVFINSQFLVISDDVNITNIEMIGEDTEDPLVLAEEISGLSIKDSIFTVTNNEELETRAIKIDGGSDIVIHNNIITVAGPENPIEYGSDSSIGAMYTASIESTAYQTEITNNRVTTRKNDMESQGYGTLYGLYIHGANFEDKISDINISNNNIITEGDVYDYGIILQYADESIIDNNTVSVTSNLFASGIHPFVLSNSIISNNEITPIADGLTYGIVLEGAMNYEINDVVSSEYNEVINNVLHLESELAWAIELYAGNQNDVNYNNITVNAANGLGIGVADQYSVVSYNNIEVISFNLEATTNNYDYIDPYTTGVKIAQNGLKPVFSNTIKFNNITVNAPSNEIYAVNSTTDNNVITDNYLVAPALFGDRAVLDTGNGGRVENNIPESSSTENTVITINPLEGVTYGDEIVISGTLANEMGVAISNQNIIIVFNDEETTVTTVNGEFSYTTTADVVGENTITATYAGSDMYLESETEYTFEVAKADTVITIEAMATVERGETLTITGSLTDVAGNAIANAQVRITINGSPKTLRTDADGVFTHNYVMNSVGENTIGAAYAGNTFYNGAETTVSVEVVKAPTVITLNPIDDVIKGENAIITGTLTDADNNAIVNAPVKVLINGSPKTVKTDADGVFTYTYRMNIVGENTVGAVYAGSAVYGAAEDETTVEVAKVPVYVEITVDGVTVGESATITGSLKDYLDNTIANAPVKVLIDGSPKTVRTDADGVFTHTYRMNTVGEHTIVAVYAGSAVYEAAEAETTVEVVKIQSVITMDYIGVVERGETVTISGVLTDENGNILANAPVKVLIDGSPKTLKTDANGVFTHTYRMNVIGEHTVTAVYAGSAVYEAAESETTVEVVKAQPVITIDPIDVVTKGDTVTITGSLTAVGNAISNAAVKVTINGSPKTLRTDANGVFTHTFKMIKVGTNNITATFNANQYYEAAEATSYVEVIEIE